MNLPHMYHRQLSNLDPTNIQDGCQHEFVRHSGVSATVGLGSCRAKLGVWTIGEVDVDK